MDRLRRRKPGEAGPKEAKEAKTPSAPQETGSGEAGPMDRLR
jgi:hypothetical protein